jgi:cystathionine beta-synthase
MGTVAELLSHKQKGKIVTATSQSKVKDVIATLKELGISQLPVVDKGKLKGVVGEVDLLRHLVSGEKTLESNIAGLIEGDYATVTPETKIELLQSVLSDAKVAIVSAGDDLKGIVTKIDLIDYLARRSAEPHLLGKATGKAKKKTKRA